MSLRSRVAEYRRNHAWKQNLDELSEKYPARPGLDPAEYGGTPIEDPPFVPEPWAPGIFKGEDRSITPGMSYRSDAVFADLETLQTADPPFTPNEDSRIPIADCIDWVAIERDPSGFGGWDSGEPPPGITECCDGDERITNPRIVMLAEQTPAIPSQPPPLAMIIGVAPWNPRGVDLTQNLPKNYERATSLLKMSDARNAEQRARILDLLGVTEDDVKAGLRSGDMLGVLFAVPDNPEGEE